MAQEIRTQDDSYEADYPAFLLALCAWREARGEGLVGMTAVCRVILNRVAAPGFPKSVVNVVLQTYAFSSFNADDPNSHLFPAEPIFAMALNAAKSSLEADDPTGGAVFYFSPPLTRAPRDWGRVEQSAKIGRLTFFRQVELDKSEG